jgi:hypothetical protein
MKSQVIGEIIDLIVELFDTDSIWAVLDRDWALLCPS